MKTFYAERLFDVMNGLGEGPLWHPIEHQLYWTDILTGTLYRASPEKDSYEKMFFDLQIGAFAFSKQGGFILATDRGFFDLNLVTREINLLWITPIKYKGERLNDGKVDPAGRFWAGSMDPQNKRGALFRLDPDDSKHIMLTEIGISNGLDWSPDRKTMYYTDSLQYTIYQFDYELDTGAITNQRSFVELPKNEKEIVPDGLCVDKEGNIWSAQWNGWQVVKYAPDGTPKAVVKVPAQRVTSCCFGSENLDTLFITTSRANLSEEELLDQPHAGDVFFCKVDGQGQTTNLFG
jgi:sugar lactone lactonase YvrE